MVDEKERIRKFFNQQYVKMKRMAAVGSLVLLAINLSFTIYPYVEHRDIHPYIAVPIIFLVIVFLIWGAAHIYIKKMEMYRTEALAEKIYNPYTVYAIGPFEEMLYRYTTIPTMEGIYHSLPDGDAKEQLKQKIDKAKHWVEIGYIPKEDFPEHLKKYYITKKTRRL